MPGPTGLLLCPSVGFLASYILQRCRKYHLQIHAQQYHTMQLMQNIAVEK